MLVLTDNGAGCSQHPVGHKTSSWYPTRLLPGSLLVPPYPSQAGGGPAESLVCENK